MDKDERDFGDTFEDSAFSGNSYDDGYEDSRNDSYEDSRNDGYEDSRNDSYEEGGENRYEDSYEDENADGYEDGYEDSYEDGSAGSYDDRYENNYDDSYEDSAFSENAYDANADSAFIDNGSDQEQYEEYPEEYPEDGYTDGYADGYDEYEEEQPRKKGGNKLRIVGVVLAGLEFILSALFIYFAIATEVVPIKYALIAAIVLGIFPILVVLMQMNKKTGIVGIVLSVLIMGIVGYGIYLVRHADKALDTVTGTKTEITVVNAYVKKEDPANSINDAVANKYIFGILKTSERDKVNATINEIQTTHATKLDIKEYNSIYEIVAALDKGEVKAFITSSAFVSALDGSEDYQHYSEGLKIILEKQVETEVKIEEKPEEEKKDAGTFCAYISGIDTFGSVSTRSRSDVNILAVVNRNTRQLLLVTTPRDFYVPLSISDGSPDKLTHAGIYGIEVSMDTLEMIYDVQIDYFLRMNFTGFIDIIDALGGVDVYSQYSFSTAMQTDTYHYDSGVNHLGGRAALAFARERHSFGDGDFQRGRNQMAVIKGVVEAMESSQLLKNFSQVMDELANSFETNMSKKEVGEIVQEQLDSNKEWNILTYEVKGTPAMRPCYTGGANASVVLPDDASVDYIKDVMKRVLGGEIMTQENLTANSP